MEDLIKLDEYGIKKVGFWKLSTSDGYSETNNNNSISFYFDEERDKCYSDLRCLYVFVCQKKVIYVGKTNQGLSRRMSSYSGTSNQINQIVTKKLFLIERK